MYSDVVLGHRAPSLRGDPRRSQGANGYALDTELTADDWVKLVARYKESVEEEQGEPFPQDPQRAALGRDRRGVRLLDERARQYLSPAAQHPRGLGHRGQCAGDGLRQYGRNFRHRRRLHAQSLDRREKLYGEFLINAQGEDVVAGIRTPQEITEAARKEAGSNKPSLESAMPQAFAELTRSIRRWSSTTATCRTSNSPSSRESSGCCRRARASAPPRRRCASRSNWRTKG